MNEFWFEETLVPNVDSLKSILEQNRKGIFDFDGRGKFTYKVRLHEPKWKLFQAEDIDEKMSVINKGYSYLLMRIGCEFDPSRKITTTLTSATVSVNLETNSNKSVKVHTLFPVEVNAGEPRPISVKIGPSITSVAGASASLGEISGDVMVGQVAPVVRGFTGEDERNPYWRLQHHPSVPIIGIRPFLAIMGNRGQPISGCSYM